jgi:hypothetical protein
MEIRNIAIGIVLAWIIIVIIIVSISIIGTLIFGKRTYQNNDKKIIMNKPSS